MNDDINLPGVGAPPAAQSGFYDPLADEPARPSGPSPKGERTDGRTNAQPPRQMIEFMTPTQTRDTLIPEGNQLVGNHQIERGSMFVIGGAPGVGKSRAAVGLAVAGATGANWFGLRVYHKFKTMIVQAENGRLRLKNEFGDLDCAALDGWVWVTPPPPYGFAFNDLDFRTQLRAAIVLYKPDVVVIDPWNLCVRDSAQRDYMEGFERILSILPTGDDRPALGIVAHTRKPRMGERASGRGLLNLLSGSNVLASVPRSVFIIQSATDATDDKRIVFTCCKNNDGELGARSAWEIRNGLFAPVENFNWEEFDNAGNNAPRKPVTEEHVREVFDGNTWLKKGAAAEKLQRIADVGRTVAYEALKHDGEFGHLLRMRPDGTWGLADAARREETDGQLSLT